MRSTFTNHERLKREQHIKTLFQTGKAFSLFPLKSIWLQLARDKELAPVRIGISVPKKKTPLAVNRNRTKRLIREAWRLNKHLLYLIVPAEIQFHLFFVYHGDPNPEYQQIEESVLKHIEHLIKIIKREGNA